MPSRTPGPGAIVEITVVRKMHAQSGRISNISILSALLVAMTLPGCQSGPRVPIATAEQVSLERFMGDWYVIAHIPTWIEKNAYNAVESYERAGGNRIQTTFTFREGGFDGKLKRYEPVGFVQDAGSNAVWSMQFIWPFKADYRIVHVAQDYSTTIIGRRKRDYVWIMARTPQIPESEYQRLVGIVEAEGYDISRLREVPQRWD